MHACTEYACTVRTDPAARLIFDRRAAGGERGATVSRPVVCRRYTPSPTMFGLWTSSCATSNAISETPSAGGGW